MHLLHINVYFCLSCLTANSCDMLKNSDKGVGSQYGVWSGNQNIYYYKCIVIFIIEVFDMCFIYCQSLMVAYLLWCLVAIFKISFINFIFSKFYYTKSSCVIQSDYCVNTLRPRQNGRHFTDDTLKRIFMNENARISINISLKFVPKGLINNIPALVQIMAWRRPCDKPLSEPMMFNLLTHICVTRPQWVKKYFIFICLTWFVSVGFHHNVRLSTFL